MEHRQTTDNTGINTTVNDEINPVLNALAEKLTYAAYTTSERNLTGEVEIMEGLTSSSVTLQTGKISFNETTGKGGLTEGSVTPGGKPDTPENNKEITSDVTFTENTAVTVTDRDTSVGAVVLYDAPNLEHRQTKPEYGNTKKKLKILQSLSTTGKNEIITIKKG